MPLSPDQIIALSALCGVMIGCAAWLVCGAFLGTRS